MLKNLPEKFLDRMKYLLKDQYEVFLQEMSKENSEKALFFNTNVLKGNDFEALCDFEVSKIDLSDNTYFFEKDGIGNSYLHHAGGIYIQDLSAMCTTGSLDIKDDFLILDMCASPGGKSIGSALKCKNGLILSNEFNVSRCKTLVSNIERFGLSNSIVINTDAADDDFLSKNYPEAFDLIICDVPCSGEGMFRKYPEQAISEWSEENVTLCAKRQKKILENAQRCVKEGGYILYSTCTFSLEENEMQISQFLNTHEDFELCDVSEKVKNLTVSGFCDFEGAHPDINLTRRFYPHISKGEGQFIALLRKKCDNTSESKINHKNYVPLAKDETKIVFDFLKSTIENPDEIIGDIYKYADNIIYTKFPHFIPKSHVFSGGVKIGEISKSRLIPHHSFFKCFGSSFLNKVQLSPEDERITKYLHGESFDYDTKNGFCAICVKNLILGGGKCVDGTVKNHYPKGLRTN